MTNLPAGLFSRMDTLFQDAFPLARRTFFGLDFGSINVKEKNDHYEMTMALPGLTDKDVKIEVKGGVLTVHAEGSVETKDEEKEYLVREFARGQIDRSFAFPRDTDTDKIEAKMDKGILHLTLPKSGSLGTSKTIEIKTK